MDGFRIALLGLISMLGGCRTVSLPPDDRPFATGAAVLPREGCFAEQGVAGPGEPVPRLSAWLWPDAPPDDAITCVRFESLGASTVVARALADGRSVHERRLEVPEDRSEPFRLAGGSWFPPFSNQGEEPAPLVGAYGEHTALGLDTAGDLELHRKGWAVGLVYLVVPAIFSGETQVRFPRVACPEQGPVVLP